MVDPMEGFRAKVDTIELKLDSLIDSVDKRFDTVEAQFGEVTSALVEQRQYTELASERLRSEMVAGFAAMSTNFGRLERKLDQLIDRIIGTDA